MLTCVLRGDSITQIQVAKFSVPLHLFNYDLRRNSILNTFLQACEVPLGTLPLDLSRKVNRSLTIEETNVLVAMNVLHGGEFSTEISDFLIYRAPQIDTSTVCVPDVVEMLNKNSADDLAWVNQTFFMNDSDQQLTIILDSTILSAKSEEFPDSPRKEIVRVVVDWCSEIAIGELRPKRRQKAVDFVRDLAVYCEQFDLNWSYDLMKLALKLRPDGPFIREKCREYASRLDSTTN